MDQPAEKLPELKGLEHVKQALFLSHYWMKFLLEEFEGDAKITVVARNTKTGEELLNGTITLDETMERVLKAMIIIEKIKP